MSKPLYILIGDGDDGSYYATFTMNTELINKLQEAYDAGVMGHENGVGVDGDGFHYTTIQVSDDATYESLGIGQYRRLSDDYANKFFHEEEEDGE